MNQNTNQEPDKMQNRVGDVWVGVCVHVKKYASRAAGPELDIACQAIISEKKGSKTVPLVPLLSENC